MEMLFNLNVSQIDSDQLYSDLINSTLMDTSVEEAIVGAVYGIQVEQMEMLTQAELYAEKIYQFSTATISLHRRLLSSTLQPTIFSNTIDIGSGGLDNVSGFVTGASAESVFREHYWRMGDNVFIQNDAFSISGVVANIDVIVTRELMSTLFLLDTAGETLIDCAVGNIVGNIRDESISMDRGINFGNAKSHYVNISSTIDMAVKTITGGDYFIDSKSLSMGSAIITSYNTLLSLKSNSGAITLSDFNSFFLVSGGYASNIAALPDDSITNTVLLKDTIRRLSLEFAPKKDWNASNLRKDAPKGDAFLNSVVSKLLSGDSSSGLDGFKSAVTKKEVDSILGTLMDSILNMDVCDDN